MFLRILKGARKHHERFQKSAPILAIKVRIFKEFSNTVTQVLSQCDPFDVRKKGVFVLWLFLDHFCINVLKKLTNGASSYVCNRVALASQRWAWREFNPLLKLNQHRKK